MLPSLGPERDILCHLRHLHWDHWQVQCQALLYVTTPILPSKIIKTSTPSFTNCCISSAVSVPDSSSSICQKRFWSLGKSKSTTSTTTSTTTTTKTTTHHRGHRRLRRRRRRRRRHHRHHHPAAWFECLEAPCPVQYVHWALARESMRW